jgi:cobalt-precorrin 5A hydrolase/precorrin-3B C17-methyltransferase
MGTASVAEAAALLTAGGSGTLRQSKRIHHANQSEQGAVTIAIAGECGANGSRIAGSSI